ncbi:hypothetical protein [Heliomicrobium modesticaldum]|uniref:ATP dependent DNA ligase n=1 Tax=Heliomicrobium modesticaldum TaxID=35701 RepID=UPI00214E7408|nr:hypothetical protein [Heliomicrobium modesticaldum]
MASLVLGAPGEDAPLYIGRVSSGLTAKEAEQWHQRLFPQRYEEENKAGSAGVIPVNKVFREKKGYTPVYPNHFVRVRYLEWTPDLQLRHPSYLGEAESSR